jgi:hypothetical protein
MANVLIDENTLKAIADAIRSVNGETSAYFPVEMVDAINKILDSATYILVDENGNEAVGVIVENEVVFDATANDIRQGKVAATSEGVTVGSKVIPSYNTVEGVKYVSPGGKFTITPSRRELYDYTKFQGIVCLYHTSLANSVASEKVAINNNVYDVKSTTPIAQIVKNDSTHSISLEITNTYDVPCVLRYFTYKEID